MTLIAPQRVVASRYLRGQNDNQYRIVIDFDGDRKDFVVSDEHAEGNVYMQSERVDDLEQACYILGSRVKRALLLMAERRRAA
jgi:hypothetical protein